MPTKSETIPSQTIERGYFTYPVGNGSTTYTQRYNEVLDSSSKVITYAGGPKYINYRCNWKECHQTVRNGWSGSAGFVRARGQYPERKWLELDTHVARNSLRWGTTDFTLPAKQSLIAQAWEKVWSNLDLNTSDACLVYSGILQAVPLVGGAFRFVSIMNHAARKLAKSFKKKPFTTVVKSLISLDFIDRFVVSPTIDDARKFIDAHNYVVNTINTAYQRSSPLPTAISQSASKYITDPKVYSDQVRLGPSSGLLKPATPYATVKSTQAAQVTSEVFLLANLAYNTDAIDPIKLWMNRVGITRPLDSVWDLVPFSFVIDYFTRAGEFISGLSDQMSHQEGLKGRILNIVGAYAQNKVFNGVRHEITNPVVQATDWLWYRSNESSNGVLTHGSYYYDRGPSNPWAYQPVEESGLFKLDLSTTRLRTLLELIIQAKA